MERFVRKIILMLAISLLPSATYANSTFIARVKVGDSVDVKVELVKLFAEEAKKEHSKLNAYLSKLKSQSSCFINDEIEADDILFLESQAGIGRFSAQCIILIRCPYKSQVSIAGSLSAVATGFGGVDTIEITEEAELIIKPLPDLY